MLLSTGSGFSSPPPRWSIEGVLLRPDPEPARRLPADTVPNQLTVAVLDSLSNVRFDVSSDVRLTAVRDSFISGNKLVTIGDAASASAVMIFDLLSRRLIDWFYCYSPQRLSDHWIACVEWYPRFVQGAPTEVVLIYDLRRTPADNRLPSAVPLSIPAPIASSPVQVGIPVFPESNVRQRSYQNVVANAMNAGFVLRDAGYVLLQHRWLVFAAANGQEFSSLRDYLAVVDLSKGLGEPVITTLDIPKDQLKRTGENPRFVKVTGIEIAPEKSVRIFVPEQEYGVGSIIVALPIP